MLLLPLRRAARTQFPHSKCIRSLSSSSPPNKVVFSGIQPTGVPHLGNYLGALRQWVKLQNEADDGTTLIYSLVDLHAITVRQEPGRLKQWRKEMFASLLAVGVNPSKSIVFHQSDVAAHSELMWILSCTASVGYLSRMTQWKSKLNVPDNAKPLDAPLQLGLFSYPVLQAADILLYKTTHVPVGQDQVQHLEFARNCAAGFNHLYGKVLIEPETILSPAKRIMSLTDPGKKMSKSAPNPKSRILITDSRAEIFKKIHGSLTDSEDGITYDPATRPGLSNLIEIAYNLEEGHTFVSCEDVARSWANLSKKAVKERVASVIDAHLAPVRDRYFDFMGSKGECVIQGLAANGAEKANARAAETMGLVRDVIGVR